MKRILLLLAFAPSLAMAEGGPLSGGETTVFNKTETAFSKPAANMPTGDLRKFTFGNRLFNTNWVAAPASVEILDGLGPLFNRVSCSGCHLRDGRGRPPEKGEGMDSMLVRLSVPGGDHPAYGGQLNERAIPGVPAEGQAVITYKEIAGRFPDGEKYSLRNPAYSFADLAYGEMGEDAMFSPRVAPAVFGLGLLEAVPESEILAKADPEDKNGDGISGKAAYVWDVQEKKKALGRFGWKAGQPSLMQQSMAAFLGDMGITSSMFPEENCTKAQKECLKSPNGGNPELSDEFAGKLEFYVSTLAVPARRDVNNPKVIEGERLFTSLGCASCHTPAMKTGEHKFKILSNQNIQPFTDLLLHDMGEGLADNRPDGDASGSEWRTSPLWGIGLIKTVNKHGYLLHDGRARNLKEAILWHGGEAEGSKIKFSELPKQEREALIKFLESL